MPAPVHFTAQGTLTQFDFICPNGTVFNQQYFVCDWWFRVDCRSGLRASGVWSVITMAQNCVTIVVTL